VLPSNHITYTQPSNLPRCTTHFFDFPSDLTLSFQVHDRERAALAEAHRITLRADLVVAELAEQDAMTAYQCGGEAVAMKVVDASPLPIVDEAPPLQHHRRPRAVRRGPNTNKSPLPSGTMPSGTIPLRHGATPKSGTNGTRGEQQQEMGTAEVEEEVEQEEDACEGDGEGDYEDDFVVHFSGDAATSTSASPGPPAAGGQAPTLPQEESLLGEYELAAVVGALTTPGHPTDTFEPNNMHDARTHARTQ
jgi:hypothetical protein